MQTIETDYLVIGAGAAGCVAAKLLGATEKSARVTLIDAHAEPGGSAGWFARGAPRRLFDAGATQLIDCEPGGLQDAILRFGAAATARDFAPRFTRIPSLTHHFVDEDARLTLFAQGDLSWENRDGGLHLEACGTLVEARGLATVDAPLLDDLRALQRVLATCEREAKWMWEVFRAIPRFPLETLGDLARAWTLARRTPPSRAVVFPLLAAASFATGCEALGLRPEHVLAHKVLAGLLLDTTQNPPEDSPWLAGLMGASILRKGIYRPEGGMRSVFRALVADARGEGVDVKWNLRATRIAPEASGWRVTCRPALMAVGEHGTQPPASVQILVRKGLVCNMTLWDVCAALPSEGPLAEAATVRAWREACAEEEGWGAFAAYATIRDSPELPDAPWFHQVFPRERDAGTLAHEANYVSIAGRHDSSNPPGERVLTTTLHVPARPLSPSAREALRRAVVERTERALGRSLARVETATPSTYARYVSRARGQVGGFRMSRSRFLLAAPPSLLRLSGNIAPLAVAGDTVFPGQGVIACMLSGVIAWERLTGRRFRSVSP